VTKPCVAFSILTANAADAVLRSWMSSDIHVKLMPKYSAISPLAPNGSVLKYSCNVIIVLPCRQVYINFKLKETPRFTRECIAIVFNCVLRFVHADTAVKENQLEKHLPYTTKSGLRIGCMYSPPPENHMSHDAEIIQMALLGIESEFSERKVLGFVAYIIFLMVLFTVLFALEM
jgi:hypothetical protein